MHLESEKTADNICKLFKNSKEVDYPTLKKVYNETLTLRMERSAI